MKKRSIKAGLPPGTLVHIGEKRTDKVKVTVIDYDEGHFRERELEKLEDALSAPDATKVTWINVSGIHQLDVIEKIGQAFHLHPLLLEDIVNTEQRPKVDEYEDYRYVVVKMWYLDERSNKIQVEQVSFVHAARFVISFQEDGGDCFGSIRERLRNGKGRIRSLGADYLLYALLDAIVDRYFAILEILGEQIEALEERLVVNPKPETLRRIHALKRDLLFFRRSVWPLREVINGLERGDPPLMTQTTKIYLRDVYDHVIQVMDTLETFREMVSAMLDVYLSSISYRINAVMKVLTVITTIFMPLTFIAGVYGMNFKYMPELEWRWGYPVVLVAMAVIAGAMLVYFRKKDWL